MMERRPGSGWTAPAVGGLLLAFALQAYPSISLKSPTFDEPPHIGAGLSYLLTGDFRVNRQHPPLLKEIAALPLALAGVRLPITGAGLAAVDTVADPGFQWRLGNAVIFGGDPDRVMFWSRLPCLLIGLVLGYALYAWGRRMLGRTAALGALALYAFDPTIIAHSTLVTTDVGFAAAALLFLFALWLYLNHRTLPRLVMCGVALGAALGSKFTGVLLLPIAFLLMAGAVLWIPEAVPMRRSSLVDPYGGAGRGGRIVWSLWAFVALALMAAVTVHGIYFFSGSPFQYLEGMRLINADHDPTYQVFMAGTFSGHFWSYYLVAYLLKTPVAAILLTTLGVAVLLRRDGAPAMDRAFVILPPAVLFAVITASSHNLGFRYLIPALPFLHLAGGAGLAVLLRAGRPGKVAAALFGPWLVAAAAGIFPDHLSYFNESACLLREPGRVGLDGGSACGPLWLDDSNVDWGQGLKQLRAWLERHAPGEVVMLGYFGSIPPERYGLRHERVRGSDLDRPPEARLYAVSAHLVARAGGGPGERDGPGSWLRRTPPDAVVGHAYYIYDLRRRP